MNSLKKMLLCFTIISGKKWIIITWWWHLFSHIQLLAILWVSFFHVVQSCTMLSTDPMLNPMPVLMVWTSLSCSKQHMAKVCKPEYCDLASNDMSGWMDSSTTLYNTLYVYGIWSSLRQHHSSKESSFLLSGCFSYGQTFTTIHCYRKHNGTNQSAFCHHVPFPHFDMIIIVLLSQLIWCFILRL